MRCPRLLVASSLVLALSSPAAADYTEVAPIRPLTMIDPTGLSVLGLDFQYTSWTVPPQGPMPALDFTTLTFDIMADIRLAPHWVILARLPLSSATADDGVDATDDCCDLALGNVTLGGRGLWSTKYDNGLRAVAGGELSLSLPTASDGPDRGGSAAAGALAHLPHDPGLYAPNTTTVRLTLLGQLYSRWFLTHAELGLDLFFYDDDVPGDNGTDTAFRLGLAAGVRATYEIAIMAELRSMLFNTNQFYGGDDTVTSINLGLRYGSGVVIAALRVYLPVDPELRDLDMIGFGVDAGWRF